MSGHASKLPKPVRFVLDNSLLLIAGTLAALIWANLDEAGYHKFVHWSPLPQSEHGHHAEGEHEEHAEHEDEQAEESEGETDAAEGEEHDEEHAEEPLPGDKWNLHYIVTDLFMALFFAIAAKEVWESMLPGGALSNPRKAAMPLLATLGGVAGPALLFVGGTYLTGTHDRLSHGWAVPCATDIAFSYLVARIVFGVGHPAIAFLLLLAIADDAAGLIILAVFYPQGEIQLLWLLLTVGAIVVTLIMRKMRLHSFWWYLLIPGVMSWVSFDQAGIHAALGLVPIIPFLPHAHTDLGIYARKELSRHDTLNEFEHFWKYPVELILGLFGLTNAGVAFGAAGMGTVLVLVGLLVGKPLGIGLFTLLADKVLKLEMPQGMNYRHILTLGMVAGLGFTVALFVSTAAFPVGEENTQATLDSVKMGALASFAAAPLAIVLAKILGVKPYRAGQKV